MRVTKVKHEDFDDPAVGVAHWRGPGEEIFQTIDDQLERFGLQIVIIDADSSDYMWRVEERPK